MEKEDIKKKIDEQRAINKEAAKIRLREYWDNLKPFETCHDVPTLPVVDANEWLEYYIPALIKAGAIPKADLVDGVYYHGAYRNSDIGKWNAEDNKFHILRWKFGWRKDTCNHFEDDDRFALFTPIRIANQEEIDAELERLAEIKK